MSGPDDAVDRAVEEVVRTSYDRLVAYLASLGNDLAAAEDALGDALAAAVVSWRRDGVPRQPSSWLLTVARRHLKGTLTATLGGFASDISTPDVRTPLPATPNVVIAELANVYASGAVSTGFSNAPTAYLNTAVTVPADGTPQVAKTSANAAFWGSWPQSFVNFQQATGLGSYWYSSGGGADDEKPQDPISVSWTLNP